MAVVKAAAAEHKSNTGHVPIQSHKTEGPTASARHMNLKLATAMFVLVNNYCH